jgi:hypothetical protein
MMKKYWTFNLHLCQEQLRNVRVSQFSSCFSVGSAKKFVRITSGFGGGEFTKTLRKVCTCQKLKFSFLLLEYCKIRECYAVANAFTIRNMYSLFLYMKHNSHKINRPTKNMTKNVEASSGTLLHQNRKLSSRISLQNQLFCLCRLPAVIYVTKALHIRLFNRFFQDVIDRWCII